MIVIIVLLNLVAMKSNSFLLQDMTSHGQIEIRSFNFMESTHRIKTLP